MTSCEKWIETGYLILAQEGVHGLQIERMARILKLNKSGFYHYFGTLEVFYYRLISHHIKCVELFAEDVKECRDFDPDFLNCMIRHSLAVRVQVQLKRDNNNLFNPVVVKSDHFIDLTILPIWSKHIGILHNDNLALHYLGWVRDGFYARLNQENSCYSYLREYASVVKEIVREMLTQGSAKRLELMTHLNGTV